MKKILLTLALSLAAAVFAEPVRITGFEDNEKQWKSANGKSGNALFARHTAEGLPDGKYALELSFGTRKDIAPKLRHWGNISFILPAKKRLNTSSRSHQAIMRLKAKTWKTTGAGMS